MELERTAWEKCNGKKGLSSPYKQETLPPTLKDFLYSQQNEDAEIEHASYLASNMNHKQQLVATMCSHPQHMEERWTLKKLY